MTGDMDHSHTPAADWTELMQRWDDLPAMARADGLAAALRTPDALVASAARRFLLECWTELPAALHSAAAEALESCLSSPATCTRTWSFFADHWGHLPDVLRAVLTPTRMRAALYEPEAAGDAWDFLGEHWDRLAAEMRAVVSGAGLSEALRSPHRRVATAAWEFVIDNWPALPQALRDGLQVERLATLARDAGLDRLVREFLSLHATA